MFYVVLCIFPLQLAAFVALLYLRPWGNLCWEASRWDHLEPSCKKAFVELLVWWCLWKPWHLIYLTLLKRFVLETKRLEIGLWRTWCCRTGGVWCWRICVWELQEPSVAMWIRQGARGQGRHNHGWESSVMNKYQHPLFEPGLPKLYETLQQGSKGNVQGASWWGKVSPAHAFWDSQAHACTDSRKPVQNYVWKTLHFVEPGQLGI